MDAAARMRKGGAVARPTRLVLAVAPTIVLVLQGGVAGSPALGSEAPPALGERRTCFSEAGPPPGPVGEGSTVVRLVVPRRVTVRLDPAGAVLAAATNTGCAPAPGDLFVVEGSGVEVHPDVAAATVAILGSSGDWSEIGRFVPAP